MSFCECGNKKIVFVHDHIFVKHGEDVYTSGTLTKTAFKRYEVIGCDITVCGRYKCGEALHHSRKLDGISFELCSTSDFWSVRKRKKIVEEAVSKADVAIIRLPSFMGLIAAKYCKKTGKPYIIEMVGCAWDSFWNHSQKGKLVAPFMLLFTKLAVKSAPYVTYVSEKFLQRRYPTKGKQLACSDVELGDINEQSYSVQLPKHEKETIVLGTVAPVNLKYKGQRYVIKGISKLKKQGYKIKYRLVGSGDNGYLKKMGKKYGVLTEMEFLGSLPHDEVFSFMRAIDIYIQPSLAESHGRVLIEAMSVGCPVIGSSTGGIPELVPPECVFKRKNVRELTRILKRVIDEKCYGLSQKSLERAKDFEREKLDRKRTEFYRAFIGEIKK